MCAKMYRRRVGRGFHSQRCYGCMNKLHEDRRYRLEEDYKSHLNMLRLARNPRSRRTHVRTLRCKTEFCGNCYERAKGRDYR